MDTLLETPVHFTDGQHGRIIAHQMDKAMGSAVVVRLDNGQDVVLPVAVLRPDGDGGYSLPVDVSRDHISRQDAVEAVLTVPVIAEELHVGKRTVETGRARITKRIVEREETIDEPLMQEEVSIEHVAINQPVTGAPPTIRYEGERMIVPLLEEVYVVEKRLMLKEELHITRIRTERHTPQTVTLRSEEVTVERVEPQTAESLDPAFE